jgi:TRAP transporter TAXI family solute receptor
MQQRLAALLALAMFGLVILIVLVWRPAPSTDAPDRVSFQIATGGSGGVFFTIGQTMAGLLSHPPGVGRCETSTVCGPSGVILSTRSSLGAFDNLHAVNEGVVDSAFAQDDVITQAVEGGGEFRHVGAQRHVRVIAALFAEEMHLVVAARSGIADVGDLRGRRVALGDGGTEVTAREILSAWHVPMSTIRRDGDNDPAAGLAAGKLDAFFVMSGVPVDAVTQLLKSGKAKLVPISGPEAERLVRDVPQLATASIAAGTYPATGEVKTVSTRAFWIVRDRAPDALIYGLVRALFNPANRAALAQSHPAAAEIGTGSAAINPPAPLHSGAARYYREIAVLR